MMRLGLIWAFALVVLMSGSPALAGPTQWLGSLMVAQSSKEGAKKKKARRNRKKKRRKKKRAKGKKKAKAPVEALELRVAPIRPVTPEEAAALAAESRRALEGRKQSKVTPGSASRWSNAGAMTPIEADVQVTAPLPSRAVPVPVGVETPGQSLLGGEELLSARFSFSAYHMETRGQDVIYVVNPNDFDDVSILVGADRDIDFFRGRASMAYERIAGSDFGVHLDLEYRPKANGSRPTDKRINELYVSYGRTDFRRSGGPVFGVALGRVAIREAGYAQADGAAFRLRIIPELDMGVFGGVTGNPYGYNWALRTSELFSTSWLTGGAFASLRVSDLMVNVAGVLTYANVAPNRTGMDRLYVFLDAAYKILPELNVFVSGWVDLVKNNGLPREGSPQLVQNVEAVAAYAPDSRLNVSLGLGRFSTLIYALSTGYTFAIDPLGNTYDNVGNQPIVGEDGNPVIPFDASNFSVVYNQVRLRSGYRIIRELEVYGTVNALLREAGPTTQAAQPLGALNNQPASLRLLPGTGVLFRDPKIIDADAHFVYILDDQSQADAMVRGGVGRGLYGLYLSVDARLFFGQIRGADGGASLSYTFPRDWLPGRLMLRATVRYYRENLLLERPVSVEDVDILDEGAKRATIPVQESYLGFAGFEWRL